jgi:hypothetical protein
MRMIALKVSSMTSKTRDARHRRTSHYRRRNVPIGRNTMSRSPVSSPVGMHEPVRMHE